MTGFKRRFVVSHSNNSWKFGFNFGENMFFRRRYSCLIFLVTFIFPSLARAEVVDKVVATVNQEVITLYELQKAMDNINKELLKSAPKGKKEEIPDLKKTALEHLIDETLINQEMEKQAVTITEADVNQAIKNVLDRNNLTQAALLKELSTKGTTFEAYREDIRGQLKRYKFIQQVMGSKVRVNADDVEALYAQNAGKLGDVQSVRIAQIVVPLSAGAGDDELKKAQARAGEIYQKAKGGGNFEALMKQYGGEGSGDLGTVTYSSLSPQLANEIGR